MPKYHIIAQTSIYIEAETEEAALSQFYDGVYEVDRHDDHWIESHRD